MNRQNIWIHITVAAIVISFAAVLGQLRNLQTKFGASRKSEARSTPKPLTTKRSVSAGEPEVLVKFRPEVTLAEIKKITKKYNDSIEDEIESVKNLMAIDDLDNADAETVARQYRALTNLVVYAEANNQINLDPNENFRLRPRTGTAELTSPNDPLFNEQWALNNAGQNGGKANADVGALKAWLKTQGSGDVVVAVLDSGVDYTHPDLINNMWMRPVLVPAYSDDELGTINDLRGFNAVENQSDPMDDNGHGTHCAGIVGAEGDNGEGIAGINWNVKIMPLKFLGRGGFGSTKNAIEAINYAIDRKRNGVNIKVINASWGSTGYSRALEDVIRAAGEEGILFVAAAGNNGTSNDKSPHYPSNYDLSNVVSVAALDRTDNLASFSNFGIKTVHIAAPGREILSTWLGDEYREASGTSMATPYVAGTAALILSSEPNLSVEKLRERLLKSVDKIDSLDGKTESGGRLNAAKALGN
ncbi:MAG: S8 family serine peptidase [Acidobacteriota bacterium]|nr:S8 family serine peptidase [Acidobacteriota bacterium]